MARQPKWYALKITALVFAITFAIVGGFIWLSSGIVRQKMEKKIFDETKFTKFTDQVIADHELMAKYDVFRDSYESRHGGRDAGPYLNKIATWEFEGTRIKGSADLPDKVRAELLMAKGLHPRLSADALKVDTSWLAKLSAFDYWDLEINSPISEVLAKNSKTYFYKLPIPNFVSLMQIAKLNVLRSVDNPKKLALAFREASDLIRLMNTTESYLAYVSGTTLTAQLNGYFVELEKTHKAPASWTRISSEALKASTRAPFATIAYFHFSAPQAAREKLLSRGKNRIALCATLQEALKTDMYSKVYAEEMYADRFKNLDSVLGGEAVHCRLTVIRGLWRDQEYLKSLSVGDFTGNESLSRLSEAPVIGKIAKLISINVGGPDYFRKYDTPDKTADP